MKKSRFTEEQILPALNQGEAGQSADAPPQLASPAAAGGAAARDPIDTFSDYCRRTVAA